MSGSACEYASSLLTRLEVDLKSGSRIGGECYAEVMNGAWTVTYLIGADAYSKINWERFYLNADTEYCGNPNHCYLYGEVKNLNEAAVFAKASLTEDEKKLVEVYTEQIKAMGG